MNSYYLEYFKNIRKVSSGELGTAIKLASEGVSADEVIARVNSIKKASPELLEKYRSQYRHLMNKGSHWAENYSEVLAAFLGISPRWFDEAPCLVAMSNFFYYLKLATIKMPSIIEQQKEHPEQFIILDPNLDNWLSEYSDKRVASWDGSLSKSDWETYRYNCLKHSNKFIYSEVRFFNDFLELMEINIPELASDISRIVQTDAGEVLRKLRLYINEAAVPKKAYVEAICDRYKLTKDDWSCPFYFSGPEDFFNLFVVCDVMLCPFSTYRNKSGKLIVAFDRNRFVSAWQGSSFAESSDDDKFDMPQL